MYGLSDDLIDYRDRAMKLEAALRLTRDTWQRQLTGLEALGRKTSPAQEFAEDLIQKLRENIKWVDGVLKND